MRIVLADQAKSDLRDIGAWIAKENPARARSFIAELRAACDSISERPFAYPAVDASSAVRRRKHGRYLIFYDVSNEVITVLIVLHAARDYLRLLAIDR